MKKLVIEISDELYDRIEVLSKKHAIVRHAPPQSVEKTFVDMVELDAITNWEWDVRWINA